MPTRYFAVESRLYTDTMQYAGATIETAGREADEHVLKQFREQLYWIRVTRAKLLLDLVFVCKSYIAQLHHGMAH